MPLAMKFFFTAVLLALAAVVSLWNGSPVRADQVWIVVLIAVGMITVIWTFPKAGF